MKFKIDHILLITFCLCLWSLTLNAQTVDEIIEKHIEAHGGAQNWEKIKSMKLIGTFTAFSTEKDFFAIKTNTGKYYSEFFHSDFKVYEAFNGEKGWTIHQGYDFKFPVRLNKYETDVFMQKAEFFTPFYKYKEKGHKVEFEGISTVEGVEVFVLNLRKQNGKTETWYLDTQTFLEYKYEASWTDWAFPVPMAETFFEDFRTIDGLVIPFFTERIFGQQRDRITVVKEVEFNYELDEELLDMPQSDEIKKLAFLLGEWEVKIEIWLSNQNMWYHIDNTISHIYHTSTNILHEDITYNYNMVYPQPNIIQYTYNSSTKKYRLVLFNGFSSNHEVYEGHFKDETVFEVDNSKIYFGDDSQNNMFKQFTISKIQETGFELEIKQSNDNGETWIPSNRLIYSRKKSN